MYQETSGRSDNDQYSSVHGRALHSSTFPLNVSAVCGIGGALRVIQRVFSWCQGVLGSV
jgi:hypothetical protein